VAVGKDAEEARLAAGGLEFSILYDTMTRRKLNGLIKEAQRISRSSVKARELVSLAKKLGQRKVNRGKEPTYVSNIFEDLRPLSIPTHGGHDLSNGTRDSILGQLDDDFCCWELQINE